VADGKLVERSEMVKGYEFAKDQYVMFSAEEMKALEDTNSAAIDIGQFVPLESVDPVYFDGTYYMDHRNTGSENIRWGLPVQSVSRSCVQFLGHSIY